MSNFHKTKNFLHKKVPRKKRKLIPEPILSFHKAQNRKSFSHFQDEKKEK